MLEQTGASDEHNAFIEGMKARLDQGSANEELGLEQAPSPDIDPTLTGSAMFGGYRFDVHRLQDSDDTSLVVERAIEDGQTVVRVWLPTEFDPYDHFGLASWRIVNPPEMTRRLQSAMKESSFSMLVAWMAIQTERGNPDKSLDDRFAGVLNMALARIAPKESILLVSRSAKVDDIDIVSANPDVL